MARASLEELEWLSEVLSQAGAAEGLRKSRTAALSLFGRSRRDRSDSQQNNWLRLHLLDRTTLVVGS
jgi:hypothetical protein